jgi:hypothetical protein
MPPRYLSLAIVAGWLATTAWMFYRDLLPRLRPDQAPPFTIDLADEVSAQLIPWRIQLNGDNIGRAWTQVMRKEDRTFALNSDFRIEKEVPGLLLKRFTTMYRVTPTGELREINARVLFEVPSPRRTEQTEFRLEGTVVDGVLTPTVKLSVVGVDWSEAIRQFFQPVRVSGAQSFLNSMQPLNRIPNLHEGQSWHVRVLELVEMAKVELGDLAKEKEKATPKRLEARVAVDGMAWQGIAVPCWRIDYFDEEHRVAARTFVRQSDGLVLQQEAAYGGMNLVLQRKRR